MRLPRDVSASELIKALRKLGYQESRQTGSHIRLSTSQNGQHHITIPNHDPIKVGTLSAILGDIANHFQMTKDAVIQSLFY